MKWKYRLSRSPYLPQKERTVISGRSHARDIGRKPEHGGGRFYENTAFKPTAGKHLDKQGRNNLYFQIQKRNGKR